MCKSDCQRVRGIGLRRFRQTEKRAHHKCDLIFSGRTAPNGGLFDSSRWIFKNWQSVLGGGENRRAPRRSQDNRGLMALHINNRFERATIGFVFPDKLNKPITNYYEARGRTTRVR